jgi:hypothetical protein
VLLELGQVVGDLNQGAFEPTKMCFDGDSVGLSASDPNATCRHAGDSASTIFLDERSVPSPAPTRAARLRRDPPG